MPGRRWTPTDDGLDREAEPTPPRATGLPRIRILTRGLAVALLGATAALCYLADRSPTSLPARATCEGLNGYAEALVFADGGRVVAARTSDGSLALWDPDTGSVRTTPLGRSVIASESAFTRDGALLAVPDRHPAVILWDLARNQRRAVLPVRDRQPVTLAFSRDGKTLAVCDTAGLQLWETTTGQPRLVPPRTWTRARALAFAPDDRTLAVRSGDGAILLWDSVDGTERILCRVPWLAAAPLTFAEHGRFLAFAADFQGQADVWDVATGQRLAVLNAGSELRSLAFAPGGRVLAAACKDGRIRLWDAPSGRLIRMVPISDEPIMAIAFSPDGRTLACGLHDSIRLIPIEGSPLPAP